MKKLCVPGSSARTNRPSRNSSPRSDSDRRTVLNTCKPCEWEAEPGGRPHGRQAGDPVRRAVVARRAARRGEQPEGHAHATRPEPRKACRPTPPKRPDTHQAPPRVTGRTNPTGSRVISPLDGQAGPGTCGWHRQARPCGLGAAVDGAARRQPSIGLATQQSRQRSPPRGPDAPRSARPPGPRQSRRWAHSPAGPPRRPSRWDTGRRRKLRARGSPATAPAKRPRPAPTCAASGLRPVLHAQARSLAVPRPKPARCRGEIQERTSMADPKMTSIELDPTEVALVIGEDQGSMTIRVVAAAHRRAGRRDGGAGAARDRHRARHAPAQGPGVPRLRPRLVRRPGRGG